MRVRIEPAMSEWRPLPGPPPGPGREARAGSPLIATGHQAWLWHPGILAKDIAMSVAADAMKARTLHLVVDHDVHDTMQVALPIREGDRLRVETLRLGEVDPGVPTGCQPPVDREVMRRRIDAAAMRNDVAVDLASLREAVSGLSDAPRSLAEQVGELTRRLIRPYAGEVPLAYSSRLLQQIDAQAIVERMLREPRKCVRAYNAAVAAHPGTGIAALVEERDRVELPLWHLEWCRPRRRVFADLADEPAILTYEDGRPIDEAARWLAPKALLLTAVMRSAVCDLFIHGTGGGVYDRVMEQWWRTWTDEPPRGGLAVVSADLYLPFDVPVAGTQDLAQAVWFRHHLPHNVDRLVPSAADTLSAARKRELLAHMGDDRDRDRRRASFTELHRMNRVLAEQYAAAIRDAEAAVERARAGLHNAAVARKRDWCLALYPTPDLDALRGEIEREWGQARGPGESTPS